MSRETINIPYYIGNVKNIYAGYSTMKDVDSACASGGVVSTVVTWLLGQKLIDGCLMYYLECADKPLEVKSRIVTSADEVLACGGSIYIDFPAVTSSTLNMVRDFDGKIAVIALPCAAKVFRRLMKKDAFFRERIVYIIGLFCGHTSKRTLIETVLEKKNFTLDTIEKFKFKQGLWRGETQVTHRNGQLTSFPSSHFTTYQNLFIDSPRKCLMCHDHYAEEADLSTGDIWMREYKKKHRKFSIFTSRSDSADSTVRQMIEEGLLKTKEVTPETLFRANKRAAIFHKAIHSRAIVGKLFGYRIKPPESALPPRWNELFASAIVMPICFISETKFRKVLFLIPRKILYLVLVLFKGLTNF